LPDHPTVRADLRCLLRAYDAGVQRVDTMRQSLIRLAKQEEPIVRFHALPGVKWGLDGNLDDWECVVFVKSFAAAGAHGSELDQ